MTNEQLAIVKGRQVHLKLKEALKALQEANELAEKMWEWAREVEVNLTGNELEEYEKLYYSIEDLNEAIEREVLIY